ncbi:MULTISPECIES: TetR/AcrR family transcriptional regulator [unclassified Novosphingobium]|uniref:TetR/AcrR family transcriptional regulator n=1 Tax=unclassified Novosphingobium TaxID=2644732 RepID=UPI001359318E|nr:MULTISPECIES: TetR/AcrR family transcriptional regulator [unclassified Novosphingobium]
MQVPVIKRSRGRPRKEDAPHPTGVLQAALRAFAQHGYAGVSLRNISQEAGVDAALIVRRYDGKFGLWRAVVDEVSAGLKDAYLPAADGAETSIEARLHATIERFVLFSLEMPDLGRFFADEISRPGERRNYVIEHIWNLNDEALLPLLREAEAAGILPPECDAETFLTMLIGAVAMPLMMRSVALPWINSEEGKAAYMRNALSLFRPRA